MRTLRAYNFLTLNGLFKGPQEDISWHTHGGEEEQYSVESLQGDGILLFGRKTYDMMASFWPTPAAAEQFPDVAAGMNRVEKIVFSRKPFTPRWNNTRVITGDIVGQVRALKATPGKNMTILGSGSIISLFTEHELIDEYQFNDRPRGDSRRYPGICGHHKEAGTRSQRLEGVRERRGIGVVSANADAGINLSQEAAQRT